jgi:hypothetical protein
MTVAEKLRTLDLDELRRRESQLAEQVEATRGRLSEYSTLIAGARREAVYAGKARPGGELGGSVRTLTDKERKDATALVGLEGDLSATRSVIAEESERLALEATAEARAALEVLHTKEEAVWSRAGELIGQLAGAWNDLVEVVEKESQLAAANGLDSAIPAVEPVPASFSVFLSLLRVVAIDPGVRAEPHTEQIVDSGIYGRRDSDGNALAGATYDTRVVGTREIEVRRRLDRDDRLVHVIPDLRSVVLKMPPLGHVPTISE